MEAGAIARLAERAADAARRARELDARFERLRDGMSLSPDDVLFGGQAADRAFGRAMRADRDVRRAVESTRAIYKAAASTEAAVAALFRGIGRLAEAETHSRLASEYELLSAVTRIEPRVILEESGGRQADALAEGRIADALDPLASEFPEPGSAMSARDVSQLRSPWFEITTMSELAELRQKLHEVLGAAGLNGSVVEEVALAVEELASNGIRHGRPPVQVEVSHSEERVVCAVTDKGAGFDWASVTDRPADDTLAEGRFGLRLAQALCDELTTVKTTEGFRVRMVKRL